LQDANGGFGGGCEVAGDFAGSADAFAVVDGDFEDAEVVFDGFDLHLEVPAVGELGHVELVERGSADGSEGAHVGVAGAEEDAEEDAYEVSGEDLAAQHGAGFAGASDAGADDEVGLVVCYWGDESGEVGDDVGAVAVHEDEGLGGGEGSFAAGLAGCSVAAWGLDDSCACFCCDGGGGVGAAVVYYDALDYLGPGHGGDDLADGFGFVEGGNDDGDSWHDLSIRGKGNGKCALAPGGRHFVGCLTLCVLFCFIGSSVGRSWCRLGVGCW
jgi:hypothetical protein